MKQEEIDTLWFKALDESIKQGELYTRYHFAALVAAAEREECAALCEQGIGDWRLGKRVSAAIRARGGE